MPIVKIENSVEIQFGTGDINVMPGLLDQETIVGAVCFTQMKQTPIGTVQHHDPFIAREIEETPVRFTFSKVESIDVLIRSLESAKRFMLNGKLDYDHKKEFAVDTAQPKKKPKCPRCDNDVTAHEGGTTYWCRECDESFGAWGDGALIDITAQPIAQGEDKPDEMD